MNKAILVFLALMGLGVAGLVVAEVYNSSLDVGYAPEQPIPFSHKTHAGDNKMECLYCHFNADKSRHATVPPTSLCYGCHKQVAGDRPHPQAIQKMFEEGGSFDWVKVHHLPEHAFFPHEKHVAAGVSCQTCHGPVETMDQKVTQVTDMSMGWCLSCHRDNNYVNAEQGIGTPNYRTSQDMMVKLGASAKYSDIVEKEGVPPIHSTTHMNAPTSCSTCHQ